MVYYRKGTSAYALNEIDVVEVNRWLYAARVAGATLDQIAELAKRDAVRTESGGYSNSGGLGKSSLQRKTIARRIQSVLEEHRGDLDKNVEVLRVLELDRLDAQLLRMNDLVDTSQTATIRLTAENTVLRVSESRRRLLGLDAPAQLVIDSTVTTIDGTSIELAQMIALANG